MGETGVGSARVSARQACLSAKEDEQALIDLATHPEADMVLIAIVGIGGLRPALAAIEAGKDLAVASKEILVMAGEVVMKAARERGVRVLPVDSEHNAIFQCLEGRDTRDVKRLILTASGGPFRKTARDELARRHSGASVATPDMGDGQQDHDRLGDPLQQGAGDDRGALAFRR